MVISKKNNFIYLRIPKNASSSLAEFFIRNFCDSNDVYTEINDCGILSNNVSRNLISKYSYQYRFIHLTLQELINNNVVSKEYAMNSRNICVIRNPFERQLSLYFFLRRGRPTSVADFRESFKFGRHVGDISNSLLQTSYSEIDGQDFGDWWVYDNLTEYKDKFLTDHGKENTIDLKYFKNIYKPKKADLINEYFDETTKNAVRKYYEKDFAKYYELTGVQL